MDIRLLWPLYAEPDLLNTVTNALDIALTQHTEMKRKYNGKPYITHPIRVALAVASYPLSKLSWISAAILHDTLEDTVPTPDAKAKLMERIEKEVGKEALDIVIELTNEEHDKKIPRRERKKLDWERLAKVSHAAKIIKMFDRIDNLRDMINAPSNFKKLYVEESIELLKVVGDADPAIADQLKDAAKFLHKERYFSVVELQGKPKGTVFQHLRFGEGWIETTGADGTMKFTDGKVVKFAEKNDVDEYVLGSATMRETGQQK